MGGFRGDPDSAPPRPLGARHTLGSSPESQEPQDSALSPLLPSTSPAASEDEPHTTLYLPWWADAWERARAAGPDDRHLFAAILDRMQAGWEYVRPLERWYEEHADAARSGPDSYWLVLEFIHGDIVDTFREIAADVTRLVPGYDGWEREASPDDVEGEVEAFQRFLTVFGLAAESPSMPDGLRELARSATAGLAGWATEMSVLAKAIHGQVLSPLDD
jgi:phytoene dehydrogenase-like protein